MPPPSPTPVVIAGCGAITKFFYASALAYLEAKGKVRVVALCDPHEPNRSVIRARFPQAAAFDRLEDAPLSQETLFVVASPPGLHAGNALFAMQRGAGVLCEKPMAGSLGDAEAMVAAAQQTGRPLAIGLYRRFFRATRVVKDLVVSGALGRPTRFVVEEGGPFRWEAASDSFFRRAVTPGGVLYDTGVHTLDLLCWWFGEPTDLAYRDDSYGGLEANCEVDLGYADGLRGRVRLSRDWATRNLFRIDFERGSIAWHVGTAGELTVRINGVHEVIAGHALPERDDGRDLHLPGEAEGSPAAFIHQLIDVVEALRNGSKVTIPPEEGIRSLRLIDRCYRARTPLAQPWLPPRERERSEVVSGR